MLTKIDAKLAVYKRAVRREGRFWRGQNDDQKICAIIFDSSAVNKLVFSDCSMLFFLLNDLAIFKASVSSMS